MTLRTTVLAILVAIIGAALSVVGYRFFVGNAMTKAVRDIGNSILVGEELKSVLDKTNTMKVYGAKIEALYTSADNRKARISILSCPGYDHYFRTIDVEIGIVIR